MSTSQINTIEALSDISNLVRDVFVEGVKPLVIRSSPTSSLFQELDPGSFRLEGSAVKFAVDLEDKMGGLATSGHIPDYVGLDAVEGQLTPVRRYDRIAIDNHVELRAMGPGAYENLIDRIYNHLYAGWERMETRHAVGPSSGLIGVVESRDSSTAFVIKDAFGNTDSNPTQFLSPGAPIAWWDLTATAAFDGAARIASIDHSTRTVTVDSAATWEPGDNLAPGDLMCRATTNNISADHFEAERNLAPNGVGTILDPAGAVSTVFGIIEGNYPRWKPYRKASSTFDHLEVSDHWAQLQVHRGFDVTPETDVSICHPSALRQLGRSMMGYQQQQYTGGTLAGGYRGITIDGIGITSDTHFYHNVFATFYRDCLHRVHLGGPMDFYQGDGSQWSRIADFDGREAWVFDYMNYVCTNRGANGALTGIVTPDVTPGDYLNVPNY